MPHQWYLVTLDKNFVINDDGDLVYDDDRSSNTSWTFPERSYCVDRITLGPTIQTHIFLLCATQMVRPIYLFINRQQNLIMPEFYVDVFCKLHCVTVERNFIIA